MPRQESPVQAAHPPERQGDLPGVGSVEVASDKSVTLRIKLYKGKRHSLRNVEKTQGEIS